MSKLYRYRWAAMDRPSELSDEDLIGKYNFYRFLLKWTPEGEQNELHDRLCDIYDEIVSRGLLKKD